MTESASDVDAKKYPMPFTRVEIAALSVFDGVFSVLLGLRGKAPDAQKWALPGGVVRIDLDQNLEAAAHRVAHERLGVQVNYLRQQCAVGGRARDPRAPWAISIVYRVLTRVDSFEPKIGKRLDALLWVPVDKAIAHKELAFDHNEIIQRVVDDIRREIASLDLPFEFLPEQFSLPELQKTCETLLGRPLDKSSFRRRLDDRDVLEPVPGAQRKGANRPAQLFRQKMADPNDHGHLLNDIDNPLSPQA